ncbi:MAG: tetratricopeptide repeat protein [Blastocatellia bacterium]|nr:tetratricopeptide repeat protein [Blastocatellia bacterium]
MSDLLDIPGLIAIDLDERNLAFEKLRIPNTAIITRATELKLGEAVNADLLIRGIYNVTGEGKDLTITVKAQIISLREGRFLGNEHALSGPLTDLQAIQGKLAWELLYQRNMALPFSREQLISRASRVPPVAYETFVKALLTSGQEDRIRLLQKSIADSTKNGQANYPQAMYELATLYYRNRQYADALKWYEKIAVEENRGLEARFYLGICQYQSGQTDGALKSFSDLLAPMPLYESYNNAAVAQLAKGNTNEGLRLVKLAAEAAPFDSEVQFNLGYAYWLKGEYKAAAGHLETVLKGSPKLGAAYYLLAKSYDKTDKATEAATMLNEAKKNLPDFAKWETSGKVPLLASLKSTFNREAFYRYLRSKEQDRQSAFIGGMQSRQVEGLLSKAQASFLSGKDDEALVTLAQVVQTAPDSSEAHLLMGRIYERRSDMPSAINALKAAVFWNPKLVPAHVLLGRLYLGQGDRRRAESHMKLALEADKTDREALALQRLLQETEKK